jgi:hypothetical protein
LPAGGAVAFNLPNPTDLAGNAGPLDGIYYTVAIAADAGPVRLVSSLPENGSKGIARNARFILTFDKPVPAAAAAAVSLLRGNEAVPLTVLSRDNPNQLVFSSIRPLAADTTYRLTIGALNSFSGAIYEGPAEISFSTSDAVSF